MYEILYRRQVKNGRWTAWNPLELKVYTESAAQDIAQTMQDDWNENEESNYQFGWRSIIVNKIQFLIAPKS